LPYDRVPLSKQYLRGEPDDHKLFVEDQDYYDQHDRKFIVFWLKDGLLVAGMNVNTWNVADTIAALVAARRPIDAPALADPAVDLAGLVPAANLTAEVDPLFASHAAAVDEVPEQAPVPGGVSADEGSAASATAGYGGPGSSFREIPDQTGRMIPGP
jgi:hypothetical protein